MESFESVISKAKDLAKSAGQKTSEAVEITKLKIDIASQEKKIAETFEGMGRLIYDHMKNEEENPEVLDECVSKIDQQKKELKEMQDKLLAYKGARVCESCGNFNDKDALYCSKCGQRMD